MSNRIRAAELRGEMWYCLDDLLEAYGLDHTVREDFLGRARRLRVLGSERGTEDCAFVSEHDAAVLHLQASLAHPFFDYKVASMLRSERIIVQDLGEESKWQA